MSAITSKVQLCNLALGGVGNRNTIMNIDTPKTDKEVIFAQWYDVVRQLCLKTILPNFALTRVIVSTKTVPTAYLELYQYALEYPVTCLKVLGINGELLFDGGISYFWHEGSDRRPFEPDERGNLVLTSPGPNYVATLFAVGQWRSIEFTEIPRENKP